MSARTIENYAGRYKYYGNWSTRLSTHSPFDLAKQIAQAAIEKKSEDVRILDLTKLDSVTDYFVICTGEVNQQVKAIAAHVERNVRETLGEKAMHREGLDSLNWVLIDYIDVVVHVFRPSYRDFYRLEDLWSDADVMIVRDDEEPVMKAGKKKAVKSVTKSAAKSAAKKPTKKAAAKKSVSKAVKKSAVKKPAVKKSAESPVKKTPAQEGTSQKDAG